MESKAVYKFEARDTEGILRGFEEVTVMDVSDGTDGEDAAIKSDTPPDDKTKLWYDTVNNVFKYWDGEKWWKHTQKTSRMRKMLREMLRNPQIQQSLA